MQGKYEEAGGLYLRATEILEKALGSDHPEVAQSLSNRGIMLDTQVIACSLVGVIVHRWVSAVACRVKNVVRTIATAVHLQGTWCRQQSIELHLLQVLEGFGESCATVFTNRCGKERLGRG